MEMTTLVCTVCDKSFEIATYRVARGYGKSCSRECSYKIRMAARITRIEKTCERCGKAFSVVPSVDAKGNGRFCSVECKWPPKIVTCANCGKEFRTSPSTGARYCSKECASSSQEKSDGCRERALRQWQDDELRPKTLKAIKERSKTKTWLEHSYFQPGERNPFYKNGSGKLNYRPQNGPETQWRRDVFRRDNHTCQQCGARGGRLNAHHVKPWKDHPELRYDLDNGITLCIPCHLATHGLQSREPNYRCIDCGILKTSGRSPRCHSCAMKNSYDVRGRKPPSFCDDCGKKLGKRALHYCQSCAAKRRWHPS